MSSSTSLSLSDRSLIFLRKKTSPVVTTRKYFPFPLFLVIILMSLCLIDVKNIIRIHAKMWKDDIDKEVVDHWEEIIKDMEQFRNSR